MNPDFSSLQEKRKLVRKLGEKSRVREKRLLFRVYIESFEKARVQETGIPLYWIACIACRFLSNLRALGKRGSRDKERQSREEPGTETTASPLCALAFKLLKPPSYTGYIPPSHTGYIPPSHTGYIPPSHTGYIPPSHTGYIPPSHTGYIPPSYTGYIPPSYTGYISYVVGNKSL